MRTLIRLPLLLLVGLSLVLGACTSEMLDPVALADGEHDAFADGKGDSAGGLTAAEEAGVLLVANTASLRELDDEVPLDRRAATNIVRHRDGVDGLAGTVDDNPFDTLAELDAVPYVGPVALSRLLAYAYAQGLVVEDETPPAAPCLIISEYLEGSGNNNKAVELFNCGSAPLERSDYGLCLVRNDDTDCTFSTTLLPGALAPGEVFTVCRTRGGTFNDPFPPVRDACQQEVGGVATFNGDDRLVVFRDVNRSGRWERAADAVMDMLGRFTWRPSTPIWADLVLRRCRLEPYDGTTFYQHTDWFTVHGRTAWEDLGRAPVEGCR
jgi:hypothetical protein